MASIRKRIVDACMARLGGDATMPMPTGLGPVDINKNRTHAIGPGELPMYSVYFLHELPHPIGGDKRRPVLLNKHITVETRIITDGTDDDADAHAIWVTNRMASADRLPQPDGTNLTLAITEAETFFETLEGSEEERTVTRIQWTVEYQTRPNDITRTE